MCEAFHICILSRTSLRFSFSFLFIPLSSRLSCPSPACLFPHPIHDHTYSIWISFVYITIISIIHPLPPYLIPVHSLQAHGSLHQLGLHPHLKKENDSQLLNYPHRQCIMVVFPFLQASVVSPSLVSRPSFSSNRR